MCARFSIDATSTELVEFFGLVSEPPIPVRQFNLAPTDDILIVRRTDAGLEGELARWGLLPWWSKDKRQGVKAINARADGLWSKPTFRDAVGQGRRCLVPTTGFFEWEETPTGKDPWLFQAAEGGLYAMAGLWERWRDKAEGGKIVETATVVTCPPNGKMAAFHDRMPVVLPREHWDAWLDPKRTETQLLPLLVAPPEDFLRPVRVSRAVNSVKNADRTCVEPVAP
jgi:putative SOS response-associated peptidase YedK